MCKGGSALALRGEGDSGNQINLLFHTGKSPVHTLTNQSYAATGSPTLASLTMRPRGDSSVSFSRHLRDKPAQIRRGQADGVTTPLPVPSAIS